MSLAFSPDQGANTGGYLQIYPVLQQNYPGGPESFTFLWLYVRL